MTTENELAPTSSTTIANNDDNFILPSNLKRQEKNDKHPNSSRNMISQQDISGADVEKTTAADITPSKDLIAGGLSGTASVIVGHPFDTIKVRLQLGGGIGSLSSIFKGMGAPASMATAINAVIFSSFGWSSRIWDNTSELDQYKGYKNFACGSFSGLVQCLIICPVEHIKCRLQAQAFAPKITNLSTASSQNIFRGPFHLTSYILKEHGVMSLFRGWYVTCWREVPAFGAYFSLYDRFKNDITQNFYTPDHPHIWTASALAGGISGSLTWAMVYPFDVIKTRIQTSPLGSEKMSDRKIWYAARLIVKERGIMSMFRGLSVTVVRAFPVNGIIFPVYEYTISWLAQYSM